MTDHYSVLGVSRDATLEQIKKAYRAKAVELHPDKQGGSHEAFAPVVRAYAILSDPEQRKTYDKTGVDGQQPIELQVQSALMTLFSQALSTDLPILKTVRDSLQSNKSRQESSVDQLKTRIKQLRKRRRQIKIKDGKLNMVHCVIDQEMEAISRGIEESKARAKICKMAIKMLDDYEEDIEIIKTPAGFEFDFRSHYNNEWAPSPDAMKRMVEDMIGKAAEGSNG